MKRRERQSGQALVGTLVIMVIVFAMAGALALAASSLLDRQSTHRTAIDSDLRASDSITAAVAQVAGRGKDSGPPCGPATIVSTLPGGFQSTATCLRLDEVAPSTLGVITLPWGNGCTSSAIASRSKVWLFFSALASSGMKVWVDNLAVCVPSAFAVGKCPFSATATVSQKAIECDLSDLQAPVLHVQNFLSSPAAIRYVSFAGGNGNNNGNNNGNGGGNQGNAATTIGSIYELVATTGLTAGPQFEQGTVFVSDSGTVTTLLSEAAL
jgi:hypothetical protein